MAIMTSILRQMTNYHYEEYVAHFETTMDLSDFLLEILMVFRDLVTCSPFPADWCEIVMLQNSVFLKALRFFSNTIRARFTDPFDNKVSNKQRFVEKYLERRERERGPMHVCKIKKRMNYPLYLICGYVVSAVERVFPLCHLIPNSGCTSA